MQAVAHIDFETQSLVDLRKRALAAYAEHPSTMPYALGQAFDDEEPYVHDSLPAKDGRRYLTGCEEQERLLSHVSRGGIVLAHNAQFELAIWNERCVPIYGWPELKASQVRCTMAMCYAMSLPGALEHALPAVGVEARKDMHGHRVMLQLARPKTGPDENCKRCSGSGFDQFLDRICSCTAFHTDENKYRQVYQYCGDDVRGERALHGRILELIPFEQRLWVVDHQINTRGVQIDVEAAQSALQVVADEKKRLDRDMKAATSGAVTKCSEVKRLTEWVKASGVDVDGLAKSDIVDLLDDDLPGDEKVTDIFDNVIEVKPGPVRRALLLRQEAGKSSLAKIDKMLAVMGSDGRVRYTKQYHAASTGRWGGRHTQFDNLPRPPKWLKKHTDQDKLLNAIRNGAKADYIAMMFGSPLDALVACVRGFITAGRGNHLIANDYSNVEGRGIAWLAGEEWKLQAFRDSDTLLLDAEGKPISDGKGDFQRAGPGIYELSYSRAFDVPVADVDEFMRQIGKVAELALGFGGGVGAFQTMAKSYGVKLPDRKAEEVKVRWRAQHPAIQRFWYALEEAAINAVLYGGVYVVGAPGREIKFKVQGSFLWMRLPSGRSLCYPYPRVMPLMMKWGAEKDALTFMAVPGDDPKAKARIVPDPNNTTKWARIATYGGSLAENATQAVARDLLAEALLRIETQEVASEALRLLLIEFARIGLGPVMHVHDEIVVEAPETAPPELSDLLAEEMCRLPAWAAGFPLTAAGWRGKRYRKG